MRRLQRTLEKPVEIQGTGLFTGQPAALRLLPAPADTGIVFVRTDLNPPFEIPVCIDHVIPKYRRMSVGREGVEVEMVEHLLAALLGMGADNVRLELDALEVPSVDGSSIPFAETLRSAGLRELDQPLRRFTVKEPISVAEDDVTLVALAADEGLSISYTLDYNVPLLGSQHFTVRLSEETFLKEIAPARTFCLGSEVDHFLSQGLGKGATYQNTLVVDADGIRENTLRFRDEFVRHKILDLVGDLCILGASLSAHIVAVKSGHTANLSLVRKIQESMLRREAETRAVGRTFLDVRELLDILPHRFPFLLIDKVIEADSWRRAVGIKNVTFNEPFFQGHFPGQPLMPGVLIIEAMAQLAGALLMRKAENAGKLAVLLALDNVKLRKTVVPGDQLRIVAETVKLKSRTGRIHTTATVESQLVAEADMKFMLTEKE